MRTIQGIDILSSATLDADRVSRPFEVSHCIYGAIHLVWSGTPTGVFRVQASNDAVPAGTDPNALAYADLTWIDIDTEAVSGAAGSKIFRITDMGFRWIALQYDSTSGTGSATTATFFAKGFGSR